MNNRRLVIGSRSSALALVQTRHVIRELEKVYPEQGFEIKIIKTTGDKILDVDLNRIGDKGLFTKEIEEALLKGEIDLAVHSAKDLPTVLPRGIKLAVVTWREDPRDAIVSKQGFTVKTLPRASRIGTSSLRRRAQILHEREDLDVLSLRGNLDTRIKKLESGLYDAIVAACAGIKRLGFPAGLVVVPEEDMLPQAGQGALGIETREDDKKIDSLIRKLDDEDSHLAVEAERAFLAGVEGGCQVPIGVYAKIKNNEISIKSGIFSLDGKRAVRDEITGLKKDAETLGRRLAQNMLKGEIARCILDEVRKKGSDPSF